MGLLAGDSGYTVLISTASSGAAGSEAPDYTSGANNGITLYCEKYQIKNDSLDKKKQLPSGKAIKILTGKRDLSIQLSNCTVNKNVTATSSAEMDAIDDFIYNHGRKRAGTKVYLFIKNNADSVYRKLSWSATHVHQRYMKGYFAGLTATGGKGKIYYIPQLTFEEVT